MHRDALASELLDQLGHRLGRAGVDVAHGAGSACGKNLSPELSSTIGDQRATNYAIQAPDNRLGRIGFDRVAGYVDDPYGVLQRHPEEVRQASRLSPASFEERRDAVDDIQIIDVRNPGEVASGSIPGAAHIPVGQIPERLDEVDPDRPTVVFCAGGYRSSVAASLLRARGVA